MTEANTTAPAFVKKSPEELNRFTLDNGETCYVISSTGDFKQLAANDIDRCFIMCLTQIVVPGATANSTKAVKIPGIFKYTKTILGVTVTSVPVTNVSDVTVGEGVTFDLPRMPMDYVNRMEKFFREIYTRHGTEAIVLLTFDRKKKDASGWGVLVPKQENTGGHCKYDQESIMKDKPAHVQIVGSAHSHPAMKAYASGTDHKDQADFDGIHITYGWLPANKNAVEYHLEIQSGTNNYILSPQQVFDMNVPLPEMDDTLEGWCEKVSKAAPVATTPTRPASSYNQNRSYQGGSEGFAWESYRPEDANGLSPGTIRRPVIKPPEGAPEDIANKVLVAMLSGKEVNKRCPICTSMVTPQEMIFRRCVMCNTYLMLEKEKLSDVVAERAIQDVGSWEIDLDMKPTREILVYDKSNKKSPYTSVYTPTVAA